MKSLVNYGLGRAPGRGCGVLVWRAWATAVGLAVLSGGAMAQDKSQPPLDINQIQPAGKAPAKTEPAKGAENKAAEAKPADSAEKKAGDQGGVQGAGSGHAESNAVPAAPAPQDGAKYPVSRFVIEYRSEHPEHPPVEDLLNATADLGVASDGYVSMTLPGFTGERDLKKVTMRVGDAVEGSGGVFYRSAINAVAQGIVKELNKRGIVGVFVQMHPEDIDEQTGKDKRDGKRSDLRLIIWTGQVAQVRSIASGERLKAEIDANPAARIDNPDTVQTRIRNQSPVQAGDLVRKDELDRYAFRLNRHPGRRVDVAIAPGENPEQVVVDYLVTESKPWSVYAQMSNTGTKTTTDWRERFGFVHNQLTGHDDILRVDYVTGGFEKSHAIVGSYEFPLISDELRLRINGQYSQFDASEVGLAGLEFSGQSYELGAELIYTLLQHNAAFLDAVGGVHWKNIKVDNKSVSLSGRDNFFLPYVGLRFERITEDMTTTAEVLAEFQVPDVVGTDINEIQNLGRLQVDDSWQVIKFNAEHSFFIEPLINPRGFRGEAGGEKGSQTLAHEVRLLGRGQWTLGNSRLIANEEDVAGGFYSVRGYPESFVAGDSLLVASMEYRFHLPRVLGVAEPGTYRGREMTMFGNGFRWTPQQAFGRADWDLILEAFVDAAWSKNNAKTVGEYDQSLYGAGVGMEFQWKRNVSARLDWGVALKDVSTDSESVSAGDNRVHFSVTVLY